MTTPTGTTTSTTGLAPNVAGALAYLLGPLTGIVFLVLEKENRFVRFHAAQSITIGLIWIALSIVLSIISIVPVIGWLIGILLSLVMGLGGLVLWLFLMWQAFQGKEWEAPFAGPLARKLIGG